MAGRFARLRRPSDDDPTTTDPTAAADDPQATQPGPVADGGDDPQATQPVPVVDGSGAETAAAAQADPAAATGDATAPAPAAQETGEPTAATELQVVDPEAQPEAAPEPEGPPGFLTRGRLRRRLRYVRRAREIALRDLGGLVFDLHRFGRDRGDLVEQKLAGLAALDAEMRALESALDDRREVTILREPGLASCPRCGALHASDASFCSSCGLPLDRKASLPAGPTTAGAPQDPPAAHSAASDEPTTPVP